MKGTIMKKINKNYIIGIISLITMLIIACNDPAGTIQKKLEQDKDSLKNLFTMKTIPAGTQVTLGGGDWQDDNPQRTVDVAACKISETLVTQKLFKAVMGFNPSIFKDKTPNDEIQELRPVDSVNWYTAAEFCNKLTELVMGKEHCVYTITEEKRLTAAEANPAAGKAEGIRSAKVIIDLTKKGFRLPAKNEWEWAAGCGDLYKYAGSNTLNEVGWNLDISGGITHQVKKLKPNKFGLYDMTGNLWEWCGDMEDGTFEASDSKTTVQKGACALCPIDPFKDIYVFQSVQTNFFLSVAREKSGFRIACNAD